MFYSGADTGIKVPFIVAANVGLFSSLRQPGICPDAFLSLNITAGEDWWERQVQSYLFWEFGKPPEVVIEVISPTPGNELGTKLIDYARMRIMYYVVYDPSQAQLTEEQARTKQAFLLAIELGLKLKFGEAGTAIFEEITAITDLNLLEAIASRLSTANTVNEILEIYRPQPQ